VGRDSADGIPSGYGLDGIASDYGLDGIASGYGLDGIVSGYRLDGIASGYGLDGPGINSGGGGGARFSAPVQTGPGAHSTSYTLGTGSFPGIKRPGRGVDYSPSSAEFKVIVEPCLFSPCGASWPVERVN
jgi:hypothetical protein